MNTKIFNKLHSMLKCSPHLLFDNNELRQAINGTFDINVNCADTSGIGHLTHQIDEIILARYFAKIWQPETKKYKYSGLSIVDEVNALDPANVLDVGCGYNEFKGKIQNLTGIDAFNDCADISTHTLDYKSNIEYDAVICLGSINFGGPEKIIKEMHKVVSLTKKGGLLFFRANPGIPHKAHESQWIDFFGWNIPFIMNIAQSLNCKVLKLHNDITSHTNNNTERFFFVLQRNK